MKSYLEPLALSHRTRIFVQVLAGLFLVYGVYMAWAVVPDMLDNMHTISCYPTERLPQVPTWLFFLLLVLAVIPGVFVFLTLKKHFQETEQTCF